MVWPHLLGGYPGLTHTAKKIKQFIPASNIYVEPFAGLGSTIEFKHRKIVCNDLSSYAINYLKSRYGMFSEIEITQEDFTDCIKRWDSAETFFFIDPPWRHEIYSGLEKPICDRKPIEYYEQLLDIVENILGDWIICSDKAEQEIKKILTKSKWNCKVIQSDEKVLFGKYAKTLICSNLFNRIDDDE
jgi:site-specific DNA-adenine methylase